MVNTSIICFFSLWFVLTFLPFKLCYSTYRAYSHEVTAAILVFENNETAAILVLQTNPVGVGLFSCVKKFFCSHKFAECWTRE